MKYNPHEYQTFAAEFIKEHPVAAILLDMGLGKTAITLTAINDLIVDPQTEMLLVFHVLHHRKVNMTLF